MMNRYLVHPHGYAAYGIHDALNEFRCVETFTTRGCAEDVCRAMNEQTVRSAYSVEVRNSPHGAWRQVWFAWHLADAIETVRADEYADLYRRVVSGGVVLVELEAGEGWVIDRAA